jgi:hypothetical protein
MMMIMSLENTERRHIGRAGWVAVGALIASAAFLILIVAADVFQAVGDEAKADPGDPAQIIEGK